MGNESELESEPDGDSLPTNDKADEVSPMGLIWNEESKLLGVVLGGERKGEDVTDECILRSGV